MDRTTLWRTAAFSNRGVTLIEMMFALVILLIMSLALMQTALLGISANVQNTLRDEAVSIAEMRVNQLTSLPFTATFTASELASSATETVVQRNFRGFTIAYTPTRTITDIPNTNTKQITVSVGWNYRGKSYTHGATTIMRRQ